MALFSLNPHQLPGIYKPIPKDVDKISIDCKGKINQNFDDLKDQFEKLSKLVFFV